MIPNTLRNNYNERNASLPPLHNYLIIADIVLFKRCRITKRPIKLRQPSLANNLKINTHVAVEEAIKRYPLLQETYTGMTPCTSRLTTLFCTSSSTPTSTSPSWLGKSSTRLIPGLARSRMRCVLCNLIFVHIINKVFFITKYFCHRRT